MNVFTNKEKKSHDSNQNFNHKKTNYDLAIDVKEAEEAIKNNKNDKLLQLTTKKVLKMNWNVLKMIDIDQETRLAIFNQLEKYKYVDEIDDLKIGNYLRWIPKFPEDKTQLRYAGILCDIVIADQGVLLSCKNFMHRHYTFKMDECYVFQKLTNQEQLILNLLEHLENEED